MISTSSPSSNDQLSSGIRLTSVQNATSPSRNPRTGRDPDTGRVKKIKVWRWALPLFLMISRFKFLRGTPFDVFGMTAHRKLERKLIADYEATVAEILDGLSADNLDIAVDIASVPEHIRGFDLVKEEQLESARAKEAELLDAFRRQAPGAPVHEVG